MGVRSLAGGSGVCLVTEEHSQCPHRKKNSTSPFSFHSHLHTLDARASAARLHPVRITQAAHCAQRHRWKSHGFSLKQIVKTTKLNGASKKCLWTSERSTCSTEQAKRNNMYLQSLFLSQDSGSSELLLNKQLNNDVTVEVMNGCIFMQQR